LLELPQQVHRQTKIIAAALKLDNQLAYAVYVPLGLGNVALGVLQAVLQLYEVH